MSEPESQPLPYRTRLAGLLGLIAAVHLPLLRYGLIYDDGWTLRSNGFLRAGQLELGLLLSPEAAARHIPDAFRPTLVVFDALSLKLLGLEAWAHHGLSIVLHLCVCVALERVLARLGASELLRLASVACFGLLAIHAEAVAVISFREDLLAALLTLLALLAALRSLAARGAIPHDTSLGLFAEGFVAETCSTPGTAAFRLRALDENPGARSRDGLRHGLLNASAWRGVIGWGLIAGGLEALACGAKLSAAPLPAIVLLLAWLRPAALGRDVTASRVWLVAALLGLGVMLALWQTWLVHGGSPYGVYNPRILAHRIGLAPVLASSLQIHVGYLQQLLVPIGLSPEYVDRGASWLDAATLASLALWLALIASALLLRRRCPLYAFTLLAWLLACLPTSNLVGMPNMRADRFMYLPSAIVCVGVAAGLLALGDRLAPWLPELRPRELAIAVPVIAFVFVQGSFGAAAARAYVSNTTLWHTAARHAPDSARAHALLGLERISAARQGEHTSDEVLAAAERSCLRAEQLDPEYELPALCWGSLAIAREEWVAAYEHHARAVELSVDRNDRPIAALAQLALDLPSDYLLAHPELGDRRELAQAWLERGLRAYPYSPELHAAAARVHHRLGHAARALELVRRARSLRPDRWETVADGVELALDLGDAAAAHHTWWADAELLAHADPATRTHLSRRLAAARTRNPADFSLLNSLLDPGVFPDEP